MYTAAKIINELTVEPKNRLLTYLEPQAQVHSQVYLLIYSSVHLFIRFIF